MSKSDKPVCPLTGEVCHFYKQIHVTEVSDGAVDELHICEKCAAGVLVNLNITPVKQAKVGFTNMAMQLIEFILQTPLKDQVALAKSCPDCQWSLTDIKKTGRLGCPSCWLHYAKSLRVLLESLHGATTHVGKVPKSKVVPQENFKGQQLEQLQKKMQIAIQEERYEEAAVLRDAITQVKLGETRTQ